VSSLVKDVAALKQSSAKPEDQLNQHDLQLGSHENQLNMMVSGEPFDVLSPGSEYVEATELDNDNIVAEAATPNDDVADNGSIQLQITE
jgi:hypothetical protein